MQLNHYSLIIKLDYHSSMVIDSYIKGIKDYTF